jgi:hypothetical protein
MRENYRRPLRDHFENSYVPEPNTGCWLWTGALTTSGYGQLSRKRKMLTAHRVSLELRGVILPDGMVVDHICRVRSCVNPDHLRVVTRRQNVIENSESLPAKQVRSTTCPQGHPYAGENLAKWSKHRVCVACKRAYGRRRYNKQKAAKRAALTPSPAISERVL